MRAPGVTEPTPTVVAEVDGALRAALSLRDGSVIAGPFHATSDLLAPWRIRCRSRGVGVMAGVPA
jgi:hypothetical protein